MAVAINVTRVGVEQTAVIVEGTLTLSGSYATGGDTVDFSGANGLLTFTPVAAQQASEIPSNLGPLGLVEIDEQPASGATPQGYIPYLIAGTTMANWLLWMATATGQPPTQLSAGAYPAGAMAQTIQFRAFFNFGV